MCDKVETAAVIHAPSDDLSFPDKDDRLAGTGTIEDHNTTALDVDRYATLLNGAEPIRYSLRSATGGSNQVATTSRTLGAYQEYSWVVQETSKVVYVEAADGAAAYECWVANTSS